MPTLKLKPTNRPKPKSHGKSKDIYDNVYNTSKWRKLRDWKLQSQPLCERCLEEGRTRLATEVHHITPISTTDNLEMMKLIGLDPTNLMSLCVECHDKIHNERRKNTN